MKNTASYKREAASHSKGKPTKIIADFSPQALEAKGHRIMDLKS
jgi:hypothetical protein